MPFGFEIGDRVIVSDREEVVSGFCDCLEDGDLCGMVFFESTDGEHYSDLTRVDRPAFSEGDVVEIAGNTNGHCYQIGETTTLLREYHLRGCWVTTRNGRTAVLSGIVREDDVKLPKHKTAKNTGKGFAKWIREKENDNSVNHSS